MDLVPKHQLFYYVGLFYFCLFSGVAYLLAHPAYGLQNTQADPSRILGGSVLSVLYIRVRERERGYGWRGFYACLLGAPDLRAAHHAGRPEPLTGDSRYTDPSIQPNICTTRPTADAPPLPTPFPPKISPIMNHTKQDVFFLPNQGHASN